MVLEELLAPAGSYEVLITAVNAGADAVYIAGPNYGARAYAKNFTMEELEKAVNYAHLNGVDIHVTVNTLVNNFEIVDVLKYLFKLYVKNAYKKRDIIHVPYQVLLIYQDDGKLNLYLHS